MLYVCAYLDKIQWNMINNLLKSGTNKPILENILYKHHHKWSHKFTKNFIEENNFHLNKHQICDLQNCANLGLLKAIKKYNGSGSFYSYSMIHMKGELYKGISQVYTIRLLPHYLRVNKKWKESNPNIYRQNMKQVKNYGDDEFILEYCKNIKLESNNPKNIQIVISELPPQDIRLFYSRYHVHDLSKKYTIKQLSILFACSEKTINKRLINIHENIALLFRLY